MSTTSSGPGLLKNAKVETGPRLENPYLVDLKGWSGTRGVVKVLLEQRNYLEAHGTSSLPHKLRGQCRHSGANRRREFILTKANRRDTRCREPLIRSVNGKTPRRCSFTPMAADNTYRDRRVLFRSCARNRSTGSAPGPRSTKCQSLQSSRSWTQFRPDRGPSTKHRSTLIRTLRASPITP